MKSFLQAAAPYPTALTATGVGGSLAVIVVWLIEIIAKITVPGQVGVAFGVVFGAILGHVIGYKQGVKDEILNPTPVIEMKG